MITIKVTRHTLSDTCTLGKMYVDGVFHGHTLEDQYRDLDKVEKVYGNTCIPPGTYKVVVSKSVRFNKFLPEVLNVPHFTGIRIHGGNTDADTLGCILVGAETNGVDRISNCGNVLGSLIRKIQGKECVLVVE